MNTDPIPKDAEENAEYFRSDQLLTIALPPPEPLRSLAKQLKVALAEEDKKVVQVVCSTMLEELCGFYEVEEATIKILASRPRQVTEKWVHELFGDYDPESLRIRLWMRTAVQKKPTSYGVLLSTFCHEFLHHLDMSSLNFVNTFHTRGFYERAGLLYHHVQDTPVRKLAWARMANGTYRIDWGRTMAGSR